MVAKRDNNCPKLFSLVSREVVLSSEAQSEVHLGAVFFE